MQKNPSEIYDSNKTLCTNDNHTYYSWNYDLIFYIRRFRFLAQFCIAIVMQCVFGSCTMGMNANSKFWDLFAMYCI